MSVFGKIFQVLMDIVFGMAIYFGMNAFLSAMNGNVIMMITLVATAIFAEFVELKFKK